MRAGRRCRARTVRPASPNGSRRDGETNAGWVKRLNAMRICVPDLELERWLDQGQGRRMGDHSTSRGSGSSSTMSG